MGTGHGSRVREDRVGGRRASARASSGCRFHGHGQGHGHGLMRRAGLVRAAARRAGSYLGWTPPAQTRIRDTPRVQGSRWARAARRRGRRANWRTVGTRFVPVLVPMPVAPATRTCPCACPPTPDPIFLDPRSVTRAPDRAPVPPTNVPVPVPVPQLLFSSTRIPYALPGPKHDAGYGIRREQPVSSRSAVS